MSGYFVTTAKEEYIDQIELTLRRTSELVPKRIIPTKKFTKTVVHQTFKRRAMLAHTHNGDYSTSKQGVRLDPGSFTATNTQARTPTREPGDACIAKHRLLSKQSEPVCPDVCTIYSRPAHVITTDYSDYGGPGAGDIYRITV
ncbi:hypothetical protein J6590_049621 [Homalodisca vitripennis]|nr:hypothetical protein J6590_049621 [Homalodisca vitripennis]